MKVLVFIVSFAYLASRVSTESLGSELKITPNYDFPDEKVKIFDIGCVLTLVCVVTGQGKDQPETPIRWYKFVNGSDKPIKANNHYELKHETLRIEHPLSSDAGTYTCMTSDERLKASIKVIANVKAALLEEYYFVESETLNITCVVDGTNPYVTWRVGNVTYDESTDRVTVERKSKYGRLLIKNVKTNDTNEYWCVVENQATRLLGIGREVATQVHIWQKYVILWPYIGVCFEVAILCAAIWFYEKRCSKPEMSLDDIEDLDEDDEDNDIGDYDISSNPVSTVDIRHRK